MMSEGPLSSSSTLLSSAVVTNKNGISNSMVDEEYQDEEEDESVLIEEYSSRKPAEDIRSQSLLWCTSCHYRLTRRGKVFKNVSERYLREDIGLGCCYKDQSASVIITSEKELVPLLIDLNEEEDLTITPSHQQQQQQQQHLLICDANVLIHNMDLLEHPLFVANIVIPQTSLEECKRNSSLSHYNRIMELLVSSSSNITRKGQRKKCAIFFPNIHHADTYNLTTSDISLLTKRILKIDDKADKVLTDNDKNDLRIRKVATYYGLQLNPANIQVILLTDDQQCRKLAQLEQQYQTYYTCHSVRDYIITQLPNRYDATTTSMLLDVISFHTVNARSNTTINTKPIELFEPYLPISDITRGIKVGTYYQGIIRCADRSSYDKCYVTIRGTNASSTAEEEDRVAVEINGIQDVNRAVDGDMVAIQLHPVHLWNSSTREMSAVSSSSSSNNATKDESPTIAMDTAEPTIQDEDNVQEIILVPANIANPTNADDEGVITQPDMSNVPLRSLKPTGKVIGIIRRNFRQNYCGSIYSHAIIGREIKDEDGKEDITSSVLVTSSEREEIAKAYEEEHADGTATCVFFAVDKRVPPILIRTSQRDRLLGQRILVAMDSWPITSLYPLGHYVKALGSIGNVSVETQVVLHEFNIPCDPFPAKVLACLPPPDYKIEMDPSRLDLRGLPVLSIDPPGKLIGCIVFFFYVGPFTFGNFEKMILLKLLFFYNWL
jgi:exosome complex exonuclease DIS3/RRP44